MVFVVSLVVSLALGAWYNSVITEQSARLVEVAQSRARMIEAIAEYDRLDGYNHDRTHADSEKVTLGQVASAHKKFKGFGDTGEFTLAKKEGNKIVFFLKHRHDIEDIPKDVVWGSDVAAPMHKALQGESGLLIGLDYRGVEVIAAYEPVKLLNYGLVAKIDLSEIKKPFIYRAIQLILISITMVTIAALFFMRISTKLLRKIEHDEALIRGVIESAEDLIFAKNLTGQYIFVNRAMERLYNLPKAKILGKTPHEILPESLADNMCLNDGLVLKNIKFNNLECHFLIDGEIETYHTNKSPMVLDNGQISGQIGVSRNVTEQIKTESSLKDAVEKLDYTAQKYQKIFKTAEVSLWDEDFTELCTALEKLKNKGVVDIRKYLNDHLSEAYDLAALIKINDVNDKTLAIYGAKSKEDFFNSVTDTFGEDGIHIFIDEVEALWTGERSFTAKSKQRKVDGSEIHVVISIPLPKDKKLLKNVPVSIVDITERIIFEQKMVEEEKAKAELEFIVNQSPIVAFLWKNKEGWPVEYVSENVSAWGYSKEQFETNKISFSDIIEPRDLKKMSEEIQKYSEKYEDSFTQEYRILTPDGSVRWIDDKTWIRRNAQGEITHYQGICIDITEQKEFERQLWQAQKSESLGNMAGGIAHDFNNMLLPIIALADLTANQLEDNDPIRKRLIKILESGQNAQELVKRLMIFAREEETLLKEVDVNDLLASSFDLLQATIPSSMEITCNLLEKNVNILGSYAQLQSVFINIAKNAADAVQGKNALLDIKTSVVLNNFPLLKSFLKDGKSEKYLHIRMKDNGPGINQKHLARIFDPFFTTKPVGEGTGMGLAMVLSIVSAHHGVITVNSRLNKGTTFDIYLPII